MQKVMEMLEKTKQISDKEMNHMSIFELFASVSEELGELGRELKIKYKTHGNTYKEADEGTVIEAADVIISALAVFYAEGGSHDMLAEIMEKKLAKWESTTKD